MKISELQNYLECIKACNGNLEVEIFATIWDKEGYKPLDEGSFFIDDNKLQLG